MLPDFKKLKSEAIEALNLYARRRGQMHMGVVGEVPRHSIHEGHENSIVRENGDEDKTEIHQAEHEATIKWSDMIDIDLRTVAHKIDAAAKDIAQQQSEHFFKTVSEGANKVGNVVDGKGQGLTADLYFQVLEKIQVDFEPTGEMSKLNFVVSPNQREAVEQIIYQFDTDPEIKKKYEKIMELKREQWRAREAARILAG